MKLDSVLIAALYVLTAVAFIGVLNARGPGRTITAALLTLFCLCTALWHTAGYRAARMAGILTMIPATPSPFATSVMSAASAVSVPPSPLSEDQEEELRELIAAVRSLHGELAAEDPAQARSLSDSAYQALEERAGEYLTRARRLREYAPRVTSAPSAEMETRTEALNLALQSVNGAARDLHAYFRAADRAEEQGLLDAFRREIDAGDGFLDRAGAGAASPDAGL